MVIHFQQAFHGRSGYTLSLTNTADPRKHQYFPKFDWPRIINPKLTFPITEENLAYTIEQEGKALLHIQESILANPKEENLAYTIEQEGKALLHIQESILANPNKVACIIIEPIQAEGGDNHFRPSFSRN